MTAGSAAVGQAHAALDRIEKAHVQTVDAGYCGGCETCGDRYAREVCTVCVDEPCAVPALVAAARGLLRWADQLATEAALIEGIGHQRDVAAAKRDAAAGIRAEVAVHLAAALTEAETTR